MSERVDIIVDVIVVDIIAAVFVVVDIIIVVVIVLTTDIRRRPRRCRLYHPYIGRLMACTRCPIARESVNVTPVMTGK